jgi:hypothetical protein
LLATGLSQLRRYILRVRERFGIFRSSLLGLATLSIVGCTAETPQSTGAAEQAVINPPLPSLNLAVNAKTTVTIGAFSQVFGDVASSGLSGSVLFDVSSSQGFGNVLATTVAVRTNASVGHIFGNDITVDGFATAQTLGLDPAALPQVPAVTPATPGTTNVSTNANQAKQLCPGQYGAISLGTNSTLNLNGGVYHVTRLTLADGARLEPSEPVVILVSGGVTTGIGAFIRPSAQSINPMFAGDIRIEVGGAVTIGESTQVRAHMLVPNAKLTTGKFTSLLGAFWAKTISIGTQSFVGIDGVFSAEAPSVPPPCNDNNACTADQCVGSGTTVAFCRNAPVPSGTSCGDTNICNGAELCDGAGQCQFGAPPSAGTSCADNDACNGDERCDGFASCLAGAPPVVSDGNACTTDACDPGTGVSHVSVADGTTCSGIGVCEGGTCSVQGTTFSEDFFQGVGSFEQCQSWHTFLNDLTEPTFNSVTINGTFDPTGVTCNDPAAATQLCTGLHNSVPVSVFCNGRTWNVGNCGGVFEISADGSTCVCDFGYVARPCVGTQFGFDNPNWGGVNTDTCFAPSQNITVNCQ